MKKSIAKLFKYLSRHRVPTRILSLFLAALMLFYVIPTVVYGEISDIFSKDEEGGASESGAPESSFAYRSELYEVEELREESVKHFHLEDGSYVAAQYPYPVHYRNGDGRLVDIDNTLTEASGGVYANTNARIKFAKKITGNETLFALHDGNTKLTFSLVGAKKKTVGTVYNNSEAEEQTKLQRMMSLERLSSRIVYADILDGVDLEYIAESLNIKENIIVKNRADTYSYSFEIKLNGLEAELLDSGAISITDTKTNEEKYVIPAPVVFDSADEYAPDGMAAYSLTDGGNGKYTLTVSVNADWMNSPERVFPVTVDPTIYHDENYMQFTSISSMGNISTAFAGSAFHRVSPVFTAFFKITDLSIFSDVSYISEAYLYLRAGEFNDGDYPTLFLHEVQTDWDESTLRRVTHLDGDGEFDATEIAAASESHIHYTWDITDTFNKWINEEIPNYGFAITCDEAFWVENDFRDTKYVRLYEDTTPPSTDDGDDNEGGSDSGGNEGGSGETPPSTDDGDDNTDTTLPLITINYVKNTGIESYLTYSSQSAGRAGSGSISHSTGDLSFSVPLASSTDSLMPVTAALVYNGINANKNHIYPDVETAYTKAYLPYGFNLNLCENIVRKVYTVSESTGTRSYYYVYEDADGTNHAFMANSTGIGTFTDEDSLNMVLTVSATGTVTLTDDSDTVKTFTAVTFPTPTDSDAVQCGWVLTSIKDKIGNEVRIDYDSSNVRPTEVSLTPNGSTKIVSLRLLYTNQGMLYAIYNVSSNDLAILRYSESYNGAISYQNPKYLRSIELGNFMSSTTDIEEAISYAYDYNDLASASINLYYKVSYSYDSNGRLTVAEDVTGKQKLSYTYSSSKVSKVEHRALGENNAETLGGSVSFSYGTGYTDVRSTGNDEILNTNDDITTRYVFDENGRSVSTYSRLMDSSLIIGAVSGAYETEACIKNNLKETTVLNGNSVNYINNGDFESTAGTKNFTYWSLSGSVSRANDNLGGFGSYSAYFTPTTGASASITQYVHLEKGDYTLSVPLHVQRADGITGIVEITSISGSGFSHSEEIPLNPNVSNGTSPLFSTDFKVTESSGDKLKVVIRFVADANVTSAPNIKVDNVSITNSLGTAAFSYVDSGSFTASAINSEGTSTATNSTFWQTGSSSGSVSTSATGAPFYDALLVSDSYGTEFKQRIYEISSEDEYRFESNVANAYTNAVGEYIVSGFAKAPDAVKSDISRFRLRVDIAYYQGASAENVIRSHYFDFNPYVDDWQFVMGTFNLAYEKSASDTNLYNRVEYVDVVCEYKNQFGTAYFDNISVIYSGGSNTERYSYYTSNGLEGLIASKESLFYEELYFYNENRDLLRVANNKGELTDYYYGDDAMLSYTVKYDFTWNGGYSYPKHALSESDPPLMVAAKTRTDYQYNAYGQCTVTETYTVDNDLNKTYESNTIYTRTEYDTAAGSHIFGAVTAEEDGTGKKIRYCYDTDDGKLLAALNTATSQGVCYTYDYKDRLTGVRPATLITGSLYSTVTNAERVDYTYDTQERISTITTDSTVYSFSYDVFGNTSGISAGSNQLATYTYNENNGKLIKITYGNGYIEEYVYNTLEMLTEVWYTKGTEEKTLAYSYEYTASGLVHQFTDHLAGKSTVYKYDTTDRLISYIEHSTDDMYNDFSSLIFYDSYDGQVDSVFYNINLTSNGTEDASGWSYSYTRDHDGLLLNTAIVTPATSGSDAYEYDDFDRVFSRTNSHTSSANSANSFVNETEYYYVSTPTYTTPLVDTYITQVNDHDALSISYDYDGNGNITRISIDGGPEIRYVYDALDQLIREDNGQLSKTFVYSYDDAGNITSIVTYPLTAAGATPSSPLSTKSYGYSTDSWGDRLTSFNGNAITYDTVGNPLTYNNGKSYSFSWTGRQMTGAVTGGASYSFTYNDDGIRTSKTRNGYTTTYFLDGSRIVGEQTANYVTIYVYDAQGSPIGLQCHDASDAADEWEVFWFEKNLQGDIIAVYDESGYLAVTYTYDAWGNCEEEFNHSTFEQSAAGRNPFRYRGYYYDTSLELYLLGTRYYDPVVGRFINADSILAIESDKPNGFNLYAYCFNNPVNSTDSSGQWPISVWVVVGIVATALTIAGVNHSINFFNKKAIDKELNETYTAEEAKKVITDYLSKYDTEDIKIEATITDRGVKITNSYMVDKRFDRQYVSSILERVPEVSREYDNLSAEWYGHNVIYPMLESNTKDVGLEFNGDPRWLVRAGTKVLEIFGME